MSPASSDRSYQPDPPVEMLGRIKLQALHTAVVTNNGDEEPLTISGFKYSLPKTILTGILFALTAGLAWLLLYWMPKIRLIITHDRCPLAEADTILVQECYSKGYKRHYVKKVYVAQSGRLGRMSVPLPNTEPPTAGATTNRFKTVQSVRFFRCKKVTYMWDEEGDLFYPLKGLDHNTDTGLYHQQSGLSSVEQFQRRLVFGPNEIQVPDHSIGYLLVKEVLNPFYVFQVASVILWLSDEYYYYAAAIVFMSVGGIVSSVYQTRQNQKNLKSTIEKSDVVQVQREDGTCEVVDSGDLVPGDVIVIPPSGCELSCDAVLVSGSAIVNEAMLTGESVPVTKTSVRTKPGDEVEVYSHREHGKHTLFRGTSVIQTRNYKDHLTKAVVIRTGFLTSKGNLVRSILYPSPVDYKFEEDSYKFVGFLITVALVGFAYTWARLVMSGETSFKEIFLDAADLITIVIPPALPAALTVGSLLAEKRLKGKGIFCISPRTINVSGSVNCVCFDKTGTLTEDGLDLLGVIKVSSKKFGSLVKASLMQTDEFLRGMATCHSLTLIDGKLSGDPLDVIMFEGTGWGLEEPAQDGGEGGTYDNLFPTVVRPPGGVATQAGIDPDDGSIGIVRQFQFSSEMQCMSVIVRGLAANHFTIYCKGSPEKIVSACRPESVPSDFKSTLDLYAEKGYRIIALSKRDFDPSLSYRKTQRITRAEVEQDLDFLGLIILENRIKAETKPVIRQLQNANLRTIMVTGDHIQTAVSVAKECSMIDKTVVFVTIDPDDSHSPVFRSEAASTGIPVRGKLAYGQDNDDDGGPDYQFALDGATYEAIRDTEDLCRKVCARGAVFARMSPVHKELLVGDLKELGYYVGMCGDGANDCGALKAANAGISLSQAEASVASPFTAREPNIGCVPQLIREGRAALVTSFGIFKYMAAYSLTQYATVIQMYEIDSNLTDIEYLYIDLALITTFAFFFGQTKAYEGELARAAPKNSLFSPIPIVSLSLQLIVMIAFQVASVIYIEQQTDWFVPFDHENPFYKNTTAESYYNATTIDRDQDDVEDGLAVACWENYAIFSVSAFQYIILAYAFSKSKPYRQMIFTNYQLIASMVLLTASTVYLVISPPVWAQALLELMPAPDSYFRLSLLGIAAVNALICVLIEDLLVEVVLSPSRLASAFRKSKAYETTLKWLRDSQSHWPPLNPAPRNHSGGTSGETSGEASANVKTRVEFEIVDEKEAFQQLFNERRLRESNSSSMSTPLHSPTKDLNNVSSTSPTGSTNDYR